MVKGISSIVAFEATSRDKGAADVEGTVVLPSGEELAHIRSLHDGMGYFEYKPEEKAGVAKLIMKAPLISLTFRKLFHKDMYSESITGGKCWISL